MNFTFIRKPKFCFPHLFIGPNSRFAIIESLNDSVCIARKTQIWQALYYAMRRVIKYKRWTSVTGARRTTIILLSCL